MSVRAKEFIETIWSEAVFDVEVFNDALYTKVKALAEMRVRARALDRTSAAPARRDARSRGWAAWLTTRVCARDMGEGHGDGRSCARSFRLCVTFCKHAVRVRGEFDAGARAHTRTQ